MPAHANPLLTLWKRDDRWICYEPTSRKYLHITGAAADFLLGCSSSEPLSGADIDEMHAARLIERDDCAQVGTTRTGIALEDQLVRRYHATTADFPYLDYSSTTAAAREAALMKQYHEQGSPPPLEEAASQARSGIKPAIPSPISILANLLFAVRGEVNETTHQHRRGFPSHGGRFPFEVYASCPQGLARYLPIQRSFSLAAPEVIDEQDVFALSCRPDRTLWRYRDEGRSYRALLADIGHAVASIELAASAAGFRLKRTPSNVASRVAKALGSNGETEWVAYACIIE